MAAMQNAHHDLLFILPTPDSEWKGESTFWEGSRDWSHLLLDVLPFTSARLPFYSLPPTTYQYVI